MRDYLKGYAFEPEAIEIMVQAFDAAWAAVQSNKAVADEDREATRTALAKRIVELTQTGSLDFHALRDGALASLGLHSPGAVSPIDGPSKGDLTLHRQGLRRCVIHPFSRNMLQIWRCPT
jgi:hypothetical protein